MKTKRFVSTLLALLLVCSLPVSAFAMDNNPAGTTVTGIPTGDTMATNYGTVENNYGTVENNYGTVENNYGTVDDNFNIVETNNGVIYDNEAEVKINNGTVDINVCAVETNNGTVNINAGNVRINNTTGIVNNDTGVVFTNYGTVNTLEYDSSVDDWVITETWYGVQVDNDGKTTLEQKKAGEVLDLTQFTKEGYELTGYTRYYQMGKNGVEELPSPITESDTSYTVTCPNVLTLIWQAIVNPGSGSGFGENASAAGETAADDGAGSFGPGSFVSINGHKFLLVAVVEDVYCLASVDSFGEE